MSQQQTQKKSPPSFLLSSLWRVMKISTATKQGSPSCEFPGSQPLSPSQCPHGCRSASPAHLLSTFPTPSPRQVTAKVHRLPLPLMRTGLLALAPLYISFGIAFTARCKAMLFAAPLRFASAALRGLNATGASKKSQVTKRKSPARTFRRSVLEVRTVGVTL